MSGAVSAARALANAGIPVIPVWPMLAGKCGCGRVACDHPGKHPHGKLAPRGVNSATTDPAQIERWFESEARLNLGIATGHKLKRGGYLLGVDVDPRHGGDETLAALERQHGEIPRAITVKTGGGGLHLYLSSPEPIRNREISRGLEIKSQGASLVAPPSVHASGRLYEWLEPFDPAMMVVLPIPHAPDWLLDLAIASQPHVASASESEQIPEGSRNATLASYAGALRRAGADQATIETALLGINQRCCEPPLADSEVRAVAKSFSRYEAGRRSTSNGKFELIAPSFERVEPVRWAWRDRIGMGMLNLLVGEEGAGKGTLISYLLAKLTTGELGGDLTDTPANVLILSEEDDLDRVWTPRLHVAGADIERIKLVRGEAGNVLSFPSGADALRRLVRDADAKIIFFDQLFDNLDSSVKINESKSVREALRPLNALARDLDVAAIGALHLNKGDGSFRQRVSGSHALNAFSRSSLIVAVHPDGPDERRVVARGKGNYTQRPVSLEFWIRSQSPRIGDHVIQTSKAADFQESALTAEQLLGTPARRSESKAAKLRDELQEMLGDHEWHDAGPIAKSLCEKYNVDARRVRDARLQIGAESESRSEFQGGAAWRIPKPSAAFVRSVRLVRLGDDEQSEEIAS